MAFDGAFVYKLNQELEALVGARVDKIHQPSQYELVLFLRGNSGNCRLIINLSANPRVYISKTSPENPETPPRFCTVMRKHLSGARIVSFLTESFERIIKIGLETYNEMGDLVGYTLVLELISSASNCILVNGSGKIVDALRRSDLENDERIIHSGAQYQMPKSMGKRDLLKTDIKEIAEVIANYKGELYKAILETVAGISPATAREIAHKIHENPTERCENIPYLNIYIEKALNEFKNLLLAPPTPTLIIKGDKPIDFSWFEGVESYGEVTEQKKNSLAALLEDYYREKQAAEQISSKSAELNRLLATLRARLVRKLDARRKDLKKSERAEEYRIKGELIKANLYQIKKGIPFVDLVNYYSAEGESVRITLDPALSPADNATRYFKEYKKKMSAKGMLDRLIFECEAEIDYIESVIEALSRAKGSADLESIRQELVDSGYLRERNPRKRKTQTAKLQKFISPSGFAVLVGRNNTENDRITLKEAEKNDVWFHTKEIHGSHVVVKAEGREVDNETLTMAAEAAAYNSGAKNSSQVPVDMTLARYVKKPSGAKPGMVIYTNQTTVFVTPKNHIK